MIVYQELSSLERDLGMKASVLYGVSNHIPQHYRTVKRKKENGDYRILHVPDEILKTIQRRIADTLLCRMEVSPYAKAYVDGGSIRRNAIPHVGQDKILKLDIVHFFDSILYSTVKDMAFPGEIYSEQNRILLTMLCYYDQVLPQGAPSSPAITNIIMRDFDEIVGRWCGERNLAYTRYCDDMTFSGDFSVAEVIDFVSGELKKKGFFLNRKKTVVADRHHSQRVTGVVVNEKLSVPLEYRRKLRQEIFFCQKYGVTSHLQKSGCPDSEELYTQKLLGRVNYVLSVMPDDQEMREYRNWIKGRVHR